MKKLLPLFLILIIFYIFWLPGPRVSTDLHVGNLSIQSANIYPWTWNEVGVSDGLGEYYAPSLWSQPLHIFFGIMALIGLSTDIQTKLLGLIILFLGYLGMWRLLDFYKVDIFGKSLGSTFFILNSFFILLFDGGQLSIALAYCLLPHILFYFFRSVEINKFKDKLNVALSLLILSTIDIRIVYLLNIIFVCFYIFQSFVNFKSALPLFKNMLFTGIISLIILIGFHTLWLLPTLFAESVKLPQTYDRPSQVDFLSFASLTHAIFLQQPHWYKNVFGRVSIPQVEFILIPMLVFLAPFLKRKNQTVGFWMLIAIIGIFLVKGSNPPFPQIYGFLFSNIPGFAFFRDPAKFYFLIALAYSILIAITCHHLARINKKIILLIFIYLFWLVRPVYLGWMIGLFSQPALQNEFNKLTEKISSDTSFGRTFWIPLKSPLSFDSATHPGIEASRMVQRRPVAVGVKGTYETFNFLREAPYMGELFDVAGISYIIYPFLDPSRDDMHPDNVKYYYTFLDQLAKRPWLTKIENISIPIFKVKQHQDRFFIPSNIWWVIGSDNLFNEATKSGKLKLSNNALIFADEYPGLSNRLDKLPDAKIVLNNKTEIDLAASFIDSSNLIFPAKDLNFSPNKSGWWKREAVDLVNWRHFLRTKYEIDNQDFDLGGGWAVGEGTLRLNVKNEKLKENKILLARILESSRSGQVSFYQKNNLIKSINTKNEQTNVRWFEVGKLVENNTEIEVTSIGDINVVNALATLDKEQWEQYKEKAEFLKGKVVDFKDINASSNENIAISYKQINPTKYIVDISNLNKDSFLVFSQNYDNLWKINGQTPFPVYGLLNGFKLDKSGQYVIEFEAQKYIPIGLVVSGLTLFCLVVLLIKYGKRS